MPAPLLSQLANIGPFFAGDSGPALDLVFLYDSGGYVDLTNSSVEVSIRRWDAARGRQAGPVIANGPATVVDGLNGEANFSWVYADPLSTVPTDPGWYALQATVVLATGVQQLSQRAVFEVLPN